MVSLLVSASLLIAIALVSSAFALRGPTEVRVTVPLGLLLALVFAGLGLLETQQMCAARQQLTFRPASLVVAQVCVSLTVVSIQHLGYLGVLVCVVAAPAGAVALCVSWTHAADGRGVGVSVVAVCALVFAWWFAGRADERPIEGLAASIGAACCMVVLRLSRRRNLARE